MKKIFITLALFCAFSSVQAQKQTVSAVKVGNHIDVNIGDKYFTSYRFEDDEKYPFFFPVNGPVSGGCVTSMRNGQFPHHSSLFFACDRVDGGNYWQDKLERGRIISVGAKIVEAKGDRVVIEDECIWKRPDAPSPFKDRRKITISSPSKELYQLDFEIEMVALKDLTIHKSGHSLFSARIDADLCVKQGGTMVNAEGKKFEKGTFGVNSPWIDYYGKRKTGIEGIVIMQHPSNKWYPSKWFTRDYGFMSGTPMWWLGKEGMQFKRGETLNLRYRVYVHAGDTKKANIAKLFEQYKNE